MKEVEYSADAAKQLVGGVISGVFTDPSKERWGFSVIFKKKPKVDVWVEQDPEGNGPGALYIHKE